MKSKICFLVLIPILCCVLLAQEPDPNHKKEAAKEKDDFKWPEAKKFSRKINDQLYDLSTALDDNEQITEVLYHTLEYSNGLSTEWRTGHGSNIRGKELK